MAFVVEEEGEEGARRGESRSSSNGASSWWWCLGGARQWGERRAGRVLTQSTFNFKVGFCVFWGLAGGGLGGRFGGWWRWEE